MCRLAGTSRQSRCFAHAHARDSLKIVKLLPSASHSKVEEESSPREGPIRWLRAETSLHDFAQADINISFTVRQAVPPSQPRRRRDRPSRSPQRRVALERSRSRATREALGTSPPPVASRGDARRAIPSPSLSETFPENILTLVGNSRFERSRTENDGFVAPIKVGGHLVGYGGARHRRRGGGERHRRIDDGGRRRDDTFCFRQRTQRARRRRHAVARTSIDRR